MVAETGRPRPKCPSARCREGADLIGIVQADGRVGLLPEPLRIDAEFVAKAAAGRAPEKRFRFSSDCLERGCGQWTGSRCGVIDKVMEALGPEAAAPERADGSSAQDLPDCGLRSRCRWFDQAGAAACRACPEVVTDTLTEATA